MQDEELYAATPRGPAARMPGAKVLLVIQNMSYTFDTRVRRISRSLQAAGYQVTVISPKYAGDPYVSRVGNIESFHFPLPHAFGGFAGHVLEYVWSFIDMVPMNS